MAAEIWTAQLHIVDGVASEDAPEIAYAERPDHRGRPAALYILAEPDRPGSEPFIGELVSQIGEEFLDGEGSLTGILQRVIRDRHDDLLEWNRTSLPRDQASYGISCLLVREADIFLMQLGPGLAYYRRGDRLLRRRPSTEESIGPLGGSETSAPEFSQLELGADDWVLLISSAVTTAIGEEVIGALRSSPAEDVLPKLYPKLRTLPRVSALVVAPGGHAAVTPIQESVVSEEGENAPADGASLPLRQAAQAVAEPAPPPLAAMQHIPPVASRDPGDGDEFPRSAAGDWAETEGPAREPAPLGETEEYENLPERTSLSLALGNLLRGFGGIFRRRPTTEDAWVDAGGEDDSGSDASQSADPAAGTSDWPRSPVGDPEIGSEPDRDAAPANAQPADNLSPDDQRAAATTTTELQIELPIDDTTAIGPDTAIDRTDVTPIRSVAAIGEPAPIAADDDLALPTTRPDLTTSDLGETEIAEASPRADAPHIEETIGKSPDDFMNAEPRDDENDDDDDNPWPSSSRNSGLSDGSGTPGGSGTGASGAPPNAGGSVEYHLEGVEQGHGGVLEARAAGWPSNPFTPPAAPVLETGQDADQARLPRPMFALEGRMLSFRGRRRQDAEDGGTDAPIAPRRGWGSLALAVLAVVGVLAVVVGVLLVPDLLENSEQGQFEDLLADARRDLTAASLTSDAAAGRTDLTSAQIAVQQALLLRPLDESALALDQEVTTALSQVNAIVRPPDLIEVLDLSGRVPPPLALSLVQVGSESLYFLDESGGRVFALPLSGGDPEVIFEAGESYPLLFLFKGPEAGTPVSMEWAVGAAGASLTILDSNAQLFRFLPGEGVRALETPNRELIGSPDAVAVDETGIFVLDVAGGSIWRFPQLSDATLLDPQPAITRTDLSTAASLAVGESLFVASVDGRIRRFSDGVDQGFPLLDLDRPLLVPASLAIGGLTGLVYAVDRGNNRVTVFTPAGELVAQLRADELVGVRGVVPDERNERLYFVTADVLLTSTLPPIISQ